MATSPPSPPSSTAQVPASPQRSSRIPKRVPSLGASHGPAAARIMESHQRHSSMPAPGSSSSPPPSAPETREQELRSPFPLQYQGRPSHAHPPQIRFPSTAQTSSPRSHSQHPPAHASSPRRCSMPPRPKMERPCSTTYTSFPLPPPRTPGDEEEERRRGLSWGNRILAPFTSSVGSPSRDLEAGRPKGNGERQHLLLPGDGSRTHQSPVGAREREGLPKLSRSCLIAEIKCYGKYMLPPIIIFVAIALTVSLYAYGKAIERETGGGGGTLAESP